MSIIGLMNFKQKPKPHFLITNDDGYDAEGIRVLREVLQAIGSVTTVAPAKQYSGCGHQVTVDRPIPVRQLDGSTWVVDGTPADCTRVGLYEFEDQIDWVIAGINHGGNLGVDTYNSGTVAAVREAALRGKPAIAVSQYHRTSKIDWNDSALMARRVMAKLLAHGAAESNERNTHFFWNVNMPSTPLAGSVPDIKECQCDNRPLDLKFETDDATVEDRITHYRYRASYPQRPKSPDKDVDVCFAGRIAISKISV